MAAPRRSCRTAPTRSRAALGRRRRAASARRRAPSSRARAPLRTLPVRDPVDDPLVGSPLRRCRRDRRFRHAARRRPTGDRGRASISAISYRRLRAGGTDVRALCAPWLDPWRFDRRLLWDQVLLPLAIARSGADLFHASAGTLPLAAPDADRRDVARPGWLRVQAHTRGYARAYFGTLQARAYRGARCDRVRFRTSARTEYRALIEAGPARWTSYRREWTSGLRASTSTGLRRPCTGGRHGRNTQESAGHHRGAPALRDLRVVSIGPFTPYAEQVRARAAGVGVGTRLELRGLCVTGRARRTVRASRAGARALALRRFRLRAGRGDGAPGWPRLPARAASLPELAGGAVPLVDPDDIPGWVAAIGSLLSDYHDAEAQAAALRPAAIASFSWRTAAERMLVVYARASRTLQ